LIDAARRIVKGDFAVAGTQRFNRFGPLRQVP
jgi:hypothetical protein